MLPQFWPRQSHQRIPCRSFLIGEEIIGEGQAEGIGGAQPQGDSADAEDDGVDAAGSGGELLPVYLRLSQAERERQSRMRA